MDKDKLWKALHQEFIPIDQRSCGNCLHDTLIGCKLYEDQTCNMYSAWLQGRQKPFWEFRFKK